MKGAVWLAQDLLTNWKGGLRMSVNTTTVSVVDDKLIADDDEISLEFTGRNVSGLIIRVYKTTPAQAALPVGPTVPPLPSLGTGPAAAAAAAAAGGGGPAGAGGRQFAPPAMSAYKREKSPVGVGGGTMGMQPPQRKQFRGPPPQAPYPSGFPHHMHPIFRPMASMPAGAAPYPHLTQPWPSPPFPMMPPFGGEPPRMRVDRSGSLVSIGSPAKRERKGPAVTIRRYLICGHFASWVDPERPFPFEDVEAPFFKTSTKGDRVVARLGRDKTPSWFHQNASALFVSKTPESAVDAYEEYIKEMYSDQYHPEVPIDTTSLKALHLIAEVDLSADGQRCVHLQQLYSYLTNTYQKRLRDDEPVDLIEIADVKFDPEVLPAIVLQTHFATSPPAHANPADVRTISEDTIFVRHSRMAASATTAGRDDAKPTTSQAAADSAAGPLSPSRSQAPVAGGKDAAASAPPPPAQAPAAAAAAAAAAGVGAGAAAPSTAGGMYRPNLKMFIYPLGQIHMFGLKDEDSLQRAFDAIYVHIRGSDAVQPRNA
mmetsp:Transcript_30521/g.88723  ORF Transcript_30521/g.88723 Transcript_30521/m.88723 type:complete len:540 (+) Transcript_30521:612-2231(+)